MSSRVQRLFVASMIGVVALAAGACGPPAGGPGTTTTSSTVPSDPVVTQVKGGSGFACALVSDGSVKCWGNNFYGQLGEGTTVTSLAPVEVTGIATATEVVTGTDFGCALLEDSTVSCWGYNLHGQLGNGVSGTPAGPSVPGPVTGLTGVTAIDAGGQNVCALLADGTASCWGRNLNGSLGSGSSAATLPNSPAPVAVQGVANIAQIDVGSTASCALLASGSVNCWGAGATNGTLGNGVNADSLVPVEVSGITTAVQISTNGQHACALLSNGSASCWGRNVFGTLGNGTNTASNVPVSVNGLTDIDEIRAGQVNTCARLQDGTAWCWGVGVNGQLGNGANFDVNFPVQVSGLTNVAQISAASQFSCAVLGDATTVCWGQNSVSGHLGDGGTANSNVPVTVLGLD